MFLTRMFKRSRSGLGMTVFKQGYEHGAFSLCTPSLGNLFTKLTLRYTELGQRCRMAVLQDAEDDRAGSYTAVPGVMLS